MVPFGSRLPAIRASRRAAGLTLRELAALVEVDVATLASWEDGVAVMRPEDAARVYESICRAIERKHSARVLTEAEFRADPGRVLRESAGGPVFVETDGGDRVAVIRQRRGDG